MRETTFSNSGGTLGDLCSQLQSSTGTEKTSFEEPKALPSVQNGSHSRRSITSNWLPNSFDWFYSSPSSGKTYLKPSLFIQLLIVSTTLGPRPGLKYPGLEDLKTHGRNYFCIFNVYTLYLCFNSCLGTFTGSGSTKQPKYQQESRGRFQDRVTKTRVPDNVQCRRRESTSDKKGVPCKPLQTSVKTDRTGTLCPLRWP